MLRFLTDGGKGLFLMRMESSADLRELVNLLAITFMSRSQGLSR